MAFAARVRGIASNCNLTKRSTCECKVEVSYLEEKCYHVVLAGLWDRDLQERCNAQALLKNIKDLSSLVQFCAAEESGHLNNRGTVSGVRGKSTYRNRQREQRPGIDPVTEDPCPYCGGRPHQNRRIKCRAYTVTCNKCHRLGHFQKVC